MWCVGTGRTDLGWMACPLLRAAASGVECLPPIVDSRSRTKSGWLQPTGGFAVRAAGAHRGCSVQLQVERVGCVLCAADILALWHCCRAMKIKPVWVVWLRCRSSLLPSSWTFFW